QALCARVGFEGCGQLAAVPERSPHQDVGAAKVARGIGGGGEVVLTDLRLTGTIAGVARCEQQLASHQRVTAVLVEDGDRAKVMVRRALECESRARLVTCVAGITHRLGRDVVVGSFAEMVSEFRDTAGRIGGVLELEHFTGTAVKATPSS